MLNNQQLNEFFEFGQTTLNKSRNLLRQFSERGFSSELKPDKSVVTEADKATEKLIREEINRVYPNHSIVGEEFGGAIGSDEFQWIIDPIDGTANFLTGIPTFGTILALFYRGEAVVGFTDHPALGLRYHAKKGGGVFCGDKALKVRGLSDKSLSPLENIAISSRVFFEYSGEEHLFDNFVKMHPNIRIYRDVFAHALTAAGAIGAMVEINNMIWDLAVSRLFAEEAGGVYLERAGVGNAANEARFTAVFGAKRTVELVAPHFGF